MKCEYSLTTKEKYMEEGTGVLVLVHWFIITPHFAAYDQMPKVPRSYIEEEKIPHTSYDSRPKYTNLEFIINYPIVHSNGFYMRDRKAHILTVQ